MPSPAETHRLHEAWDASFFGVLRYDPIPVGGWVDEWGHDAGVGTGDLSRFRMNTKRVKGKAGTPRERKLADSPKYERKNERRPAERFDTKPAEHTWTDPRHENEARSQVKGAGEAMHNGAGVRHGERSHPEAPEMRHFGHSGGEIGEHQAAIIDKHAESASIFKHGTGHKPSEELAPESRSRKATKN